MEAHPQCQHWGGGGRKILVYRLASFLYHTVMWGSSCTTLASAGTGTLFFLLLWLPRLLMYGYNIFFHLLILCCPIGLSAAWAVMSNDRPYAHIQFLLSRYILISLGDVSRNRAAGFHKHISTSRSLCNVFWSGFSIFRPHCSRGRGHGPSASLLHITCCFNDGHSRDSGTSQLLILNPWWLDICTFSSENDVFTSSPHVLLGVPDILLWSHRGIIESQCISLTWHMIYYCFLPLCCFMFF